MNDQVTVVAGIVIPSVSPVFLTIVAVHVLVALVCVIAGVVAMLSEKRRGRHPWAGAIYYWFLSAVFASATVLSALRWQENYHLFILGLIAFAAASLGRAAVRGRWKHWARIHIAGMGTSYVFLLIAFYVDNGKNLPLWKDLPPALYWLLPAILGAPLILRALLSHPLARGSHAAHS